jgi:hypothetical protein
LSPIFLTISKAEMDGKKGCIHISTSLPGPCKELDRIPSYPHSVESTSQREKEWHLHPFIRCNSTQITNHMKEKEIGNGNSRSLLYELMHMLNEIIHYELCPPTDFLNERSRLQKEDIRIRVPLIQS